MSNQPITTRPPTDEEKFLQQKFSEAIVDQVAQMDKLGQQLLTLELAIPGLYATVLTMVKGKDTTLSQNWALYATFTCWFAALLLTLVSLFPRQRTVDRDLIRQDPAYLHESWGIEDFFERTAAYKRNFLMVASLFFFGGIALATLTIF
ncbi:hypothetical protein QUF63_09480 [Anaerolineales bacterium HSG25]|nr:hypothetical protein [Anaerolineales bacterium HSG25]